MADHLLILFFLYFTQIVFLVLQHGIMDP